ncbi:MAG: hypothetical protein EHM45_17625 [Desulfobacteraceae bacterium]|nr:MAG: hypothetical protein EHM45_17625 [Desulfobacteraceae bacterium]
MEISQQGKTAIILVARKRIERIELRLKDLEAEISELKQFFGTLPEDLEFIPEEKTPDQPAPPKPKPAKKKSEEPPLPIIKPEPEKPAVVELPEEEDPIGSETVEFQAQVPLPKPVKPVANQGELSAIEIKVLRLIATLEESEHQLPYIASRLNMPQPQAQTILEQLNQKGLIYSHDPTSQEAEYDMDQKGLEYLAKKGLL